MGRMRVQFLINVSKLASQVAMAGRRCALHKRCVKFCYSEHFRKCIY